MLRDGQGRDNIYEPPEDNEYMRRTVDARHQARPRDLIHHLLYCSLDYPLTILAIVGRKYLSTSFVHALDNCRETS